MVLLLPRIASKVDLPACVLLSDAGSKGLMPFIITKIFPNIKPPCFQARGFSNQTEHLASTCRSALQHIGEVLCLTTNMVYLYYDESENQKVSDLRIKTPDLAGVRFFETGGEKPYDFTFRLICRRKSFRAFKGGTKSVIKL